MEASVMLFTPRFWQAEGKKRRLSRDRVGSSHQLSLCARSRALSRSAGPFRCPAQIALIFSAIEFVEDHSLLEIVNAGTAVCHASGYVIPVEFRCDGDGLLFWRVQIGIVDEFHQDVLSAAEICLHQWQILGHFNLNPTSSQRRLGKRESPLNDFFN